MHSPRRSQRAWVRDVQEVIRTALSEAQVHVGIKVDLVVELLDIKVVLADITVGIDGTIDSILAATPGTVTANLTPQEPCSLWNVPACTIQELTRPLLALLERTSTLAGSIGPTVGALLNTVILGANGVVAELGTTLTSTLADATTPLTTTLNALLTGFFGEGGLVSLRANVQNDPATGADPDPSPLLTYPEWRDNPLPPGQYDVAALSLSVLTALGSDTNVNLELARGSVGVNCALGGAADRAGLCTEY